VTNDKLAETVYRIDENVKHLLKVVPIVTRLEKESAVNKREHRIAFLLLMPLVLWVAKKFGIPFSGG
jgi:hypothetical protein